jgi:DNA-binding CsgD family transcriptional regulator
MTGPIANPSSRKVFVAGANNLQNELIASTLSKATGIPCIAVEGLSHIKPLLKADIKDPCLALYDCFGKDNETCLFDLKESGADQDLMLGLFNLKKNAGLEREAFAYGARGFFYKGEPFSLLVKGIAGIFEGEFWISRQLLSEWVDQALLPSGAMLLRLLSAREKEILRLLAGGATNKEIGNTLFLSEHAIKNNLQRIFRKLDVHSKIDAAFWAERHLNG